LTPYDNLDTLNYTQISKNATATLMYTPGQSHDRRQSVNLNLSFQGAADKRNDVAQNSGSRFFNINASYSLSMVPEHVTLAAAINGNVNDSPGLNTKTFGPTLSASKSFLDRQLRVILSTSYNAVYTGSQRVSTIVNARAGGNYVVHKRHSINLSLVMVRRESQSTTHAQSFTEFTSTLGYGYAFSTARKQIQSPSNP